jgi:hypothetical protein
MATRRRRGGGHGKPSAVRRRQSIRRSEAAIRAANAAVEAAAAAAMAAQKAKRASTRKRMNVTNAHPERRQSARIQQSTMKSIRMRVKNLERQRMKEMANSYANVIRQARKTEKAARRAEKAARRASAAAAVDELESLMSGMKVARKNNNVNNIANAMRRMGF